ncbi:MAG: helix-turn-helix transcriptional regulator [Clostridia bacterium]|nr:helix-turn-helix transcriptional regulator [Clostridia bacterium]
MFMKLKELREAADKTQAEVAAYLNVKQNTYSQYENEKREIPIESLIRLAKFYSVSVDYILGLTENDTPYN